MPQNSLIWLIDDDESTVNSIARAFQKEQLECQLKAFKDVDALLTEMQQNQTLPTLLITYLCHG